MYDVKYEDLPIISTGPFTDISENDFLKIILEENCRRWYWFRNGLIK